MTFLSELLFQNINFFQKYDDDGYPIEFEDDQNELEEGDFEEDDGFDDEPEETEVLNTDE